MPGITIIGSGSFAPGAPVTNAQLSRVMDTTDEWIKQRTGISERHFVGEGVGASDLGYEAAKRAIEDAGITAQEIDYIIFGTMTPDYAFPGPGGLLGAKLGIPGVPALDIRQQCAAAPFSFQVANGLVATGVARTVLIVGAEAHAGFMPWDDWDLLEGKREGKPTPEAYDRATRHRSLAVLFGDGAGALIVRAATREGHGLLGVKTHSDGRAAEQIYLPGGGFKQRPYLQQGVIDREEYIPRMAGKELFKNAVQKLPEVVREVCRANNVTLDDVDWFIAHQANDRINEAVREALKLPREKVPSNIARYGNTSAGTIPILVDELRKQGKLKEGQLLCFLALGSGLHWGAALMRL